MKRIKLCWSIARIINAHTDRERQRGKKQIRWHIHIQVQIHIQNWLSRHSRASAVGTDWRTGANCQMLAKQKTAAVSGLWQRSWRGYQFQFPLPEPPSSLSLPPLLLLRAIKRWFPAFCLQFSAISLQTHTHTQTKARVPYLPFNITLMCNRLRVCVSVCYPVLQSVRFKCVGCESRLSRLTARFIAFIGFIGFVCLFPFFFVFCFFFWVALKQFVVKIFSGCLSA